MKRITTILFFLTSALAMAQTPAAMYISNAPTATEMDYTDHRVAISAMGIPADTLVERISSSGNEYLAYRYVKKPWVIEAREECMREGVAEYRDVVTYSLVDGIDEYQLESIEVVCNPGKKVKNKVVPRRTVETTLWEIGEN